jgi:hypothetical protein
VTFVAQHEIGDLYEATTAYEPAFHILFIVSSAYRRKYKLTAALFRCPRHETLHDSERYFVTREKVGFSYQKRRSCE